MTKRIIALVLSSLCLVPALSSAQAVQENAPSSYTVVKGDTLWGIAGKFLKEPWRWPEVWNMNKDQIKDPHWIYPGDVIKLEYGADGKPRLSLDGSTLAGSVGADGSIKVVPRVRIEALAQAIPSIAGTTIAPFLTQPMVIEEGGLNDAPRIIATEDSRVIVGTGDIVYIDAMAQSFGTKWQVFRPGAALRDPDTQEILGYEAAFLGDVRVTGFGPPARAQIVKVTQEINRGDRLTPARETAIPSYSPRAPDHEIIGKIMHVNKGVAETGQYAIVVLNRGKRDGLEIGHVLATFRAGETVNTRDEDAFGFRLRGLIPNQFVPDTIIIGGDPLALAKAKSEVKLPDERNGLVFVFRVFDRLSYALVMQTRRPIYINDVVRTP